MSKEIEAVILSAVRTPIGKFQGVLSGIPAPQLGAVAIQAAVERARLPQPTDIDEVLMGNVVQAGSGRRQPDRQPSLPGCPLPSALLP